ncbi:WecB/TagA/CpsF family glycosyltransferase [Algoriphagus resistens]|uniref:WecB/TagA/CpsF family glycosyltransferase n=1 Tax=Algoriphagus resistens TaxID=1750590 RepID=UPI0007169FE7|nr:WecB/TagA/CpsF family glycosyltransferase [Algoriphagus resistens]
MDSIQVNGVKLHAPSSKDELILNAFSKRKILVAVNAEKILMANEEFANFISSNIGYPDGIGAVWLLQRRGFSQAIRIPGVELWLDIIKSHNQDKTFYLVGGTEEVIQDTVSKLKKEFQSINIVGFRNGFLKTDDERSLLKNDIVEKRPDVVFVAMGSPVQENLMKELQLVHSAVYQGLGGSFDVYTGKVERAPKKWRDNNLEWAYRLYKEPWRIKRQIHLIKFLPYILFNKK